VTAQGGGRVEGEGTAARPEVIPPEETPGRAEAPEPVGPDEPPPFLGSWGRLYAIVLLELIVLIALFYSFTKAFR